MTRQAQVGAFAIVALLALFGVFYVVTDFGLRQAGYKVGVHFQSASGLHLGSSVYFSGVGVGSVDTVVLLPDNTVDVIVSISRDVDIPSNSTFIIQAPLTGDPNLYIIPPPVGHVAAHPLPHGVAPVEQQPQGVNAASVADLMQQGQGEIKRLDTMLASIEAREPKILNTLQATLDNANALTVAMNRSVSAIAASMQSSLGVAGQNIVALTGTLNDATTLDAKRIDAILTQFQAASVAMNSSMTSIAQLAKDPTLHQNLIATTKNIAETTETIAALTKDLRSITGDPQTQAQVKDTIAHLDATMQRANSLLGALGGKSSVYGVDVNATPAPTSTTSPAPKATPHAAATPSRVDLTSRLTQIAHNLVALQVRVSGLSAQHVCCPSPLFTADQGPQADVNAIVFPNAPTSLYVGANNIGYTPPSTTNVLLVHSTSSTTRIGGGVMYSQLGLLGLYNQRLFGIRGNIYDPRRPALDLIGNVNVVPGLQLFFGERDLNHVERRGTYGLQLQF